MSSSLRVTYRETVSHLRPFYGNLSEDTAPAGSFSFQHLQRLIADNQEMHETLNTLSATIAATRRPGEGGVQESLESLQEKVATSRNFLDYLWDGIPVDRKPSDRTRVKALEVFGTPELLEHILQYLSPPDLLRAQQVGRDWRDGVNGSVKLQRQLGLAPSATGFYYSPFAHSRFAGFPMIQYTTMDEWDPYQDDVLIPRAVTNEIEFAIGIHLREAVYIGTRCEAMRICQAPIKHLSIRFSGDHLYWRGTRVNERIEWTGDKDITIGTLLDKVHAILDKARWAKRVDWRHLEVIVAGTVVLDDEDPIMLQRREQYEEALAEVKAKASRRRERIAEGKPDYDSDEEDLYW